MTRRVFVLLFLLASLGGQPLLAAEEGTADGDGSAQPAGQESAEADKKDSAKKPAKPEDEDEEPECD